MQRLKIVRDDDIYQNSNSSYTAPETHNDNSSVSEAPAETEKRKAFEARSEELSREQSPVRASSSLFDKQQKRSATPIKKEQSDHIELNSNDDIEVVDVSRVPQSASANGTQGAPSTNSATSSYSKRKRALAELRLEELDLEEKELRVKRQQLELKRQMLEMD